MSSFREFRCFDWTETNRRPTETVKRFGGSCHSFHLFCRLQSHTIIITFVQYTHPSPFAEASLQFDREHILLFFTENLGFSRFFFSFFSFFFGLFWNSCFGCFASIPKQRVSMFRLNRNKQKTHQNSLKESIFGYFSKNLGLFRFVTKQICLFRLFRYRFETPKQIEFFSFWFQEPNRNKRETDLVSVCFGSNRNLFLFVSRTPSFITMFIWNLMWNDLTRGQIHKF